MCFLTFLSFSESIRNRIFFRTSKANLHIKMSRIFLKSRQCLKVVDFNDVRFISTFRGKWFATSTDAVSDFSNDHNLFDEKVEKYSLYHPTPISIAHFIEFGQKSTAQSSFAFLKREVPVRWDQNLSRTNVSRKI